MVMVVIIYPQVHLWVVMDFLTVPYILTNR